MLLWSAGSGMMLGLIVDAMLIGAWLVASNFLPSIAPRSLPRWALIAGIIALAAIPLLACVVGYLEGRLKLS
jgi:hypothetical protein